MSNPVEGTSVSGMRLSRCNPAQRPASRMHPRRANGRTLGRPVTNWTRKDPHRLQLRSVHQSDRLPGRQKPSLRMRGTSRTLGNPRFDHALTVKIDPNSLDCVLLSLPMMLKLASVVHRMAVATCVHLFCATSSGVRTPRPVSRNPSSTGRLGHS